MTVSEIIDGILERKAILNATIQQISDASGVPKSTVDNILRKSTANPTMQNVLDIANAVGYEFSAAKQNAPETDDVAMKQIIYIYEQRCADLERESRLKTVQSNLLMAEKTRWIKFLTTLCLALVAGIIIILLYDVTNPNVGWFRG